MFVIRERLYAHPVFFKINVLINLRTVNKTQISRLVRTYLLQQLWVPKHVLHLCVLCVLHQEMHLLENILNTRVSSNHTTSELHLMDITVYIAYLQTPFSVYCRCKEWVEFCLLSFLFIFTFPLFGFDLLKPTGHMMHQQFNIQQLYALPTLYLCVLYLSQNKQRLVPLTA